MNRQNLTLTFLFALFLATVPFDAFSACDNIEPDCTIDELDTVHPHAISFSTTMSIGGAGYDFEGTSDDSATALEAPLCEYIETTYGIANIVTRDCKFIAPLSVTWEICQAPDGNGGCQRESAWSIYTNPILESRVCLENYPFLDIQDNNKCHKPRIDKLCTGEQLQEGNPICISTQSKVQNFNIYSGKGANALSYNVKYDSSNYVDSENPTVLSTRNFKSQTTAKVTFLKQVIGLTNNLRIDLPSGTSYHFYPYGNGWKPVNESAGWIAGNTYHTSSGRNYNFSSLPASHRQTVFANQKNYSNGQSFYYSFDEINKKSVISNEFGKSITLQFSPLNQVSSLLDPAGNLTSLSYDAMNNLTKITFPDGKFETMLYENVDFPNHLTGILNENGDRVSTYRYDTNGYAISTQSSDGILTSITKTDDLVTIQRTDGTQQLYTQTKKLESFKSKDRVVEIQTTACPGCTLKTESFEYNASGILTAYTSDTGVRDEYSYDSFGLPTYKKFAAGTSDQTTEQIMYNYTHKKPYIVWSTNHVSYSNYDANGMLTLQRDLDYINSQWRNKSFTYNDKKQLTISDGPRTDVNDITNFDYDISGNLTSITNALGQTIYYRNYDAHGNILEIEDANGLITILNYNSRQWLTSLEVGGQITSFQYDDVGNLLLLNQANGSTLSYKYDLAGKVTEISNLLGEKMEYQYDGSGNVTKSTLLNSASIITRTQTSVYDSLKRLSNSLGANGQSSTYSYDLVNNKVEKTDALASTTTEQYDLLNRLTKTIDPNGGETAFTYDKMKNIDRVTDPENKQTQYTYNSFGETIKIVSPDTGTTTFIYDTAGNLLKRTDARGVVVTFTYDALNRPLTQSYSDTSENIVYSYDDTASGNKGVGRLTSVTDQTGSTSYFYNSFGQVSKETRMINGKTYVTEYHFDSNGQLTGMTYPSGRVITYTFDGLARVSGLTSTYQAQVKTLASNINYLPFGPMSSLTYGNGKVLTQSFDLDYRLTDKSSTGIHQMAYGYDVTDNITSITGNLDSNNSQSFTYDKLSRLLISNGEYGSLGFTYDKIGNRLSKTDNGSVDTYAYTTDTHRLANVTGANPKSFTHDEIGNTLSKDGLSFTYNQQGRLQSASKTGMNAAYLYNFKGERSSKQVEGVTTHFIYDLNGQLIAEADNNGVIQREYIYLNGQRFATIDGSTLYYVHTDHLGTPIALTDEAGMVQWKAHYTPFGKAIVDVDNLGQNIRFPGQYFDSETNLHYNYFRDYDPSTGRYLQSDPIGLAGGINTYGYVSGNPVNLIDPYGLACFDSNKFFNQIRENRASNALTFGSLLTTGVIGTMPKSPSELRGLGVPRNQLNPITNQLSRWSGRFGTRALRVVGRGAKMMVASAVATLSVVGEGFYDWGVIGKAAYDATSSEENCSCEKK